MNGGGIIIIEGQKASGQDGSQYTCTVAVAQSVYDYLSTLAEWESNQLVINLGKAISDASS